MFSPFYIFCIPTELNAIELLKKMPQKNGLGEDTAELAAITHKRLYRSELEPARDKPK